MTTNDIRDQVREFMVAAEQVIPEKPVIPHEKIVRLRAALVAEEFFELMEATYGKIFEDIKFDMRDKIGHKPLKVDMVETEDAVNDLFYVLAGLELAYGVDGKPIFDEVHRTNMAKFGPGSWKDENGKQRKPADWVAPNISALLEKQGWEK